MKLLTWLNHSGVWVAFVAALLTAESFAVLGLPPAPAVVLRSFFLALSAYLFLRREMFRGKKATLLIALTGAVLTCGWDAHLPWMPLSLAFLAVMLYDRRIWKEVGLQLPFDLRSIRFLKPLIIGGIWALITSMPAVYYQGDTVPGPFFWLNLTYLTGMAMAADIRDRAIDERPLFNKRRLMDMLTGSMCIALLLLSQTLYAVALYIDHFSLLPVLAVALPALLSIVHILVFRRLENWQMNAFLLDGWIVLRCALLLMALSAT